LLFADDALLFLEATEKSRHDWLIMHYDYMRDAWVNSSTE
jgi:hypothetical protein